MRVSRPPSFSPTRPALLWSPARGLCAAALGTCLLLLPGCEDPKEPEPEPPKIEVTPVDLADLPEGAQFTTVGHAGRVYQLEAEEPPVSARFPVAPEAVQTLLPDTLRLFRFKSALNQWEEIDASSFDAGTGELVGDGLEPGLYTGFGWSTNPAENAIQRLGLDARLGYRPQGDSLRTLAELRKEVEATDLELRPDLVRNWLLLSFSLERTTCETLNNPDCDPLCQRLAGRTKLSSCPSECPEPECCECETFSYVERLFVPRNFLDPIPQICPGGLCPICPQGLSCPTGPYVQEQAVHPRLEVPAYEIFQSVALSEIVEDEVLRDVLHQVVEESVGTEYPVPPPWP